MMMMMMIWKKQTHRRKKESVGSHHFEQINFGVWWNWNADSLGIAINAPVIFNSSGNFKRNRALARFPLCAVHSCFDSNAIIIAITFDSFLFSFTLSFSLIFISCIGNWFEISFPVFCYCQTYTDIWYLWCQCAERIIEVNTKPAFISMEIEISPMINWHIHIIRVVAELAIDIPSKWEKKETSIDCLTTECWLTYILWCEYWDKQWHYTRTIRIKWKEIFPIVFVDFILSSPFHRWMDKKGFVMIISCPSHKC